MLDRSHDHDECPQEETLSAFVEGGLRQSLAASIERHLDGCSACREVLQMFAVDTAHVDRTVELPSEEGTSVGRYVVLEVVGQGAMGQVLRAYDPKLQREVALKRVSGQVLGAEARARMLLEARAMAQLTHPNVVPVYDAEESTHGVTLVMQYVAGQDLRRWLRSSTRSWKEILAYFVQAGRGLAAAHAVDLLHRDFKPANVLVSQAEEVKVTDFGLAKLMASGASTTPRQDESIEPTLGGPTTVVGTVRGTPRYMAPEQHRGEELKPAADQYAYCVSLWEALAGEPPFRGTSVDALRADKEQGPRPWSAHEVSVPRRVAEALRRGLAPEPDARWPDMATLLSELDHEPTRWPPRRLWVTGALGVAMAGAGMWSWLTVRAQRCSGAEMHMAAVWDQARRDEVRAAMLGTEVPYAEPAWSHAARELDGYAERWTAAHTEACEATAVRQEQSAAVMDLRMACLHRARVELSAVAGELTRVDRETMRLTHKVVAGLPPLTRCSDTSVLHSSTPDDEIAPEVASLRAELASARAAMRAGRYDEAVEALTALATRSEALSYEPLHAEILVSLGLAVGFVGRFDDAKTTLEQALRIGLSWQQRHVAWQAATSLVLTVGYQQQRIDEGLAYAPIALGLAGVSPEPRFEAKTLAHIGMVRLVQGNYAEAEANLRSALAKGAEELDPDSLSLASWRDRLGVVLESQGRFEEAIAEHRRAHESFVEILGPSHPLTATSRIERGSALRAQGKLEQAEVEYRAARPALERALGPEHPDVIAAYLELGRLLRDRGLYERAEAEVRSALSKSLKLSAPNPLMIAHAREDLGKLLYLQGQPQDGEIHVRRALASRIEALGPDHPHVAVARTSLGNTLSAQGRYAEAEDELRTARSVFVEQLGADHLMVAAARINLGSALRSQDRYEEAEVEYRESIPIVSSVVGPEHDDLVTTQIGLADCLRGLGRLQEAMPLAEQAWTTSQRSEDAENRAESAFVLARIRWASTEDPSSRQRAISLAQQALASYERDPPPRAGAVEELRAWLRRHAPGR